MKIRPATRSDAPSLMEIRMSVRENVISPERLEELAINETSVASMLETTHSGHCAEVNGQVVGFAMADKASASIWALFVRPEFEGIGIGARLLDTALEELWRAGHERVHLSTEPDTRAFRFYIRQGWRHVGFTSSGEAELELVKPKPHPS
jgi:ribosomal protein S18 acetylase RimI-like enzyme